MRVLLAILFLASGISAHAEEFRARVFAVVDGDTIRIEQRVRNVTIEETCRMRLYNAPELHGAEKAEGARAKKHLADLVLFRDVRIVADGRDKYDRLLCDVHLDGGESVTVLMRAALKDYPGLDKYRALY